MQVPLELSFRDIPNHDQWEAVVRQHTDKLERFHDHLTACRVAVERPNEGVSQGSGFRVRVDLTVPPNHEIVATQEPGDGEVNDELGLVLNRAFSAAERQLRNLKDRQSEHH